uniref:peptidylprolyl isomerase n=1 Tax=Bicosoecida sp. CB-2014 TaxID=1486930 RepID=A0A7S1CSC1_9STRA|mmetsp:Transcript_8366/g.29744  ORF Transcript_8366/g.29744 Transcript_8366/m.29744 type:complete len:110 (+) Transcript_8366:49-378(+)|eukprot:CAMPEP_0203806462 /NCGR_PEP_ID=MMETSP0115-20131106/498_1 /ASSEMBLY_ACC=CAM_ASM_000227 /TAXON_ID=33651 /ORGANISM="Bicosoecid sp, Strain ms1" /LENGTH=109 /DNA_ID=CAMNT_0050715121 /DNA_START=44 /DNA_END=373 /DNA_ORIENTATION=-
MGIVIETIRAGDGTNRPKKGDTVRVHYVGTFEDGKKFDSSRDRNRPFEFKLGYGQVIPGWDEVLPQMSKNQVSKVIMTPDMCYGPRGYPPIIPPNCTLVYEIELISFVE